MTREMRDFIKWLEKAGANPRINYSSLTGQFWWSVNLCHLSDDGAFREGIVEHRSTPETALNALKRHIDTRKTYVEMPDGTKRLLLR